MKKTSALLSFVVLASLATLTVTARPGPGVLTAFAMQNAAAGQQPAAPKQAQWKSRDEYDAFNAMASERDPNKRISLAEAFLQKFSNSDFKANAYVAIMQTYAQLNNPQKATDAARKAIELDPDNLDALVYLSYVFPFTFKGDDPDAADRLSRADGDGHRGLEVLQKLQKPSGVSDEQFNQSVKVRRAIFNAAVGFVALQRKDYPGSITSFRASMEDNPADVYTVYRLGLAYLYSTPRDYDHGIWYIARAVSLAKASQNPAGPEIEKFLKRAYVDYHGNEGGLSDIVAQAATSPNPPEGFKVVQMETPKRTGKPNVDAFNTLTFPLKLGGEKAEKQWAQVKGQTIELGGSVHSVEKGTDPGTYLVRIDVLDQSKAADLYDIELKDSAQPNVKNLQKGDLVMFKGTADSYSATPNLVLTLAGEITTDLPEKPAAKEKPKTTKKPAPHRTTRRTQG